VPWKPAESYATLLYQKFAFLQVTLLQSQLEASVSVAKVSMLVPKVRNPVNCVIFTLLQLDGVRVLAALVVSCLFFSCHFFTKACSVIRDVFECRFASLDYPLLFECNLKRAFWYRSPKNLLLIKRHQIPWHCCPHWHVFFLQKSKFHYFCRIHVC